MRKATWTLDVLLAVALAASVAARSYGQERAPDAAAGRSLVAVERQTYSKVNDYRTSRGLTALSWNDAVAEQARLHSVDMASGASAFGHDGFDSRMHAIVRSVAWTGVAENVFMLLNFPDPAAVAVRGWLDSPGHKENIEGDYDVTGVGIARSENGTLYFTQIFVKSKAAPRKSR